MSLKPKYFCYNCQLSQPKSTSTLKTCSRCKMVKYCDVECQKSHFPKHKAQCAEFKKLFNGSVLVEDSYEIEVHLFQVVLSNARTTQDYFAYERAIEIFNTEYFVNSKDYGVLAWYMLTESYWNLGQYDKALYALENWEKSHNIFPKTSPVTKMNVIVQIAVRVLFKLNKIAEIRANPPEQAVKMFEALNTTLLESSQENYLKLAASSPVMDTIRYYVNLSFVEELQDECVAFMSNAFENKEEAFIALSSIVEWSATDPPIHRCFDNQYDLVTYNELLERVQNESHACDHLFKFGLDIFPRHPEFQDVYQKYKKVYENL